MGPEKLTEKNYWNSVYEVSKSETAIAERRKAQTKSRHSPKKFISDRVGDYFRAYSDYLEWDVILPACLPKDETLRVIEIGSAPGLNLVRLHQAFGYIPYGVEYSETGVEINRRTFLENSLPPENVLQADFFSEEFLDQHRESFDVVISKGFIEHFDDVEGVIQRHQALLKETGYLVISIPRFLGIGYLLSRFFNKAILPMHNLKIMHRPVFQSLFKKESLQQKYCDYLGMFRLSLCDTMERSGWRFQLMMQVRRIELLLNFLCRVLLRGRKVESYFLSPYLLYVGKKTEFRSQDSEAMSPETIKI